MLKKRILTSMILGILTLLWMFFTPLVLFSSISAAMILCSTWEWSAFMGLRKNLQRILVVVLMSMIIVILHIYWPIDTLWQQGKLIANAHYVFVFSFAWWLGIAFLILTYPSISSIWNKSVIVRFVTGVFTLVPPWFALNVLRSAQYHHIPYYGSVLLIIVFLIVVSNDIGAYFVGKCFGKHKLIPKVSPNKTIEGLLGGVITSVIVIILFFHYVGMVQNQWTIYTTMTVVIALFSVIGDLFESMLKREVGLKESGSLLPGHGGMMDRVDGLIAAVPTFTLCYIWITSL